MRRDRANLGDALHRQRRYRASHAPDARNRSGCTVDDPCFVDHVCGERAVSALPRLPHQGGSADTEGHN